jgi:hypothetical protein
MLWTKMLAIASRLVAGAFLFFRYYQQNLYSPASSHQPPGGSIGAIHGRCIEGNRRAWGSLMNSVDDGFE